MISRCSWCGDDHTYVNYHDKEWGVPLYDDQKLFEFLILEGAQAGLSWITVLKKRENYRKLFDNFDPEKIARYTPKKVEELLQNPGIIRNRLKVESTIINAKMYLKIQEEFGSFALYNWQFVEGRPIHNRWNKLEEMQATSKESDLFSRDLKERGFKFVGSTIIYSHMQATGMVNDHITSCFRYQEIIKLPLPQ